MQHKSWIAMFCLAMLLVTGTYCAASFPSFGLPKFRKDEAKAISWMTDLKEAHKVAVQLKKPMLVTFGAPWCAYCKKMDETSFSDAKVVSLVSERFVAVHLDFEKNRDVAGILEVQHLPTIVILSPEADLLGKINGFKKADDLKDELSKVLSDKSVASR